MTSPVGPSLFNFWFSFGGGGALGPTLNGRFQLLFLWGVLPIPPLLAAAELGEIFVFLTVGVVETSLPKANSGFRPFRFAAVSPKDFCSNSSRTLANIVPFLRKVSSGIIAPTLVRTPSPFLPKWQIPVV